MLYRYQNEYYTTCECMCLYISIYVIVCAIQLFYVEYVCANECYFCVWAGVCICVWAHVCVHVCVYGFVCVCECVCVCFLCVSVCVCVCVSDCVFFCFFFWFAVDGVLQQRANLIKSSPPSIARDFLKRGHSVWERSKIRSQCSSVKAREMESQKYLKHFLLNKKMFWLSSFSIILCYKILPTILHVSNFFEFVAIFY